MRCVPTSIAGKVAVALVDKRQNGRLAAVKVITSPEATTQAVTTKRKRFFDSVCRHAGYVMKPLPAGFVDFHAVTLQRQRYTKVEEPCINLLADVGSTVTINHLLQYTHCKHQHSRHRYQLLRHSPSMYQIRRTANNIRRAPEQDMLRENDSQ